MTVPDDLSSLSGDVPTPRTTTPEPKRPPTTAEVVADVLKFIVGCATAVAIVFLIVYYT